MPHDWLTRAGTTCSPLLPTPRHVTVHLARRNFIIIIIIITIIITIINSISAAIIVDDKGRR